jgi:hypothetical protein
MTRAALVSRGRERQGEQMEFLERAALRIEHWMEHNDSHQREYEKFAAELEQANAAASAGYIREMAQLEKKSKVCLQKALGALGSRET